MSAELLQKAEEQASRYLETHRIPDPYFFDIENGKLVSPNTKVPIEKIIVTSSSLGIAEYEAFEKIQKEVNVRNSGFVIWISPPHPYVYPVSKIVISEIVFEEKKKRLLNRAILTKWDSTLSILAAQELASLSAEVSRLKSSADVRKTPILIEKAKGEELSAILKRILDRKSIKMVETGHDFAAKQKFMHEFLINGKVLPSGPFSESCPTAFQVFSGAKEYLCCKCPLCGSEVIAEIYEGEIHCPKCKEKRPYRKAA